MENLSVSGGVHIHHHHHYHYHYHYDFVLPNGTPTDLAKGIRNEVAAFDDDLRERRLSRLSRQELAELRSFESQNLALILENERLKQYQLQQSVKQLEIVYNFLPLNERPSSQNSMLPTKPSELPEFRHKLENYLMPKTHTAGTFNERHVFRLPTVAMDSVWYRFTQHRLAAVLGTPPHIKSRFNSAQGRNGGIRTIAMAEDVPSALFELSVYHGLDAALEKGNRSVMVKIQVAVDNIVDLRDSKTTLSLLGIGAGDLQNVSDLESETVLQKLSGMLVGAGFSGAIVPSIVSVGKSQLVLFPDNFHEGESADILSVFDVSQNR